jgi:serine/threonine protein kinase
MLKSPAKILLLWEKGTKSYLKTAKLAKLEAQEEVHNKKIVEGLKKLRAIAKKEEQADVKHFNAARDQTADQMDKFRKLFKPKKDKTPALKILYKQVCRLTVTVEALSLDTLDASEDVVDESVLDDIDADVLDKRDDMISKGADQKVQKGNVPQPPPQSPPPSKPTPKIAPGGEAALVTKRLHELLPSIKTVQSAVTSVTDKVKVHMAEIQKSVAANDFAKANQHLDKVGALVPQGLKEIEMAGQMLDQESSQIKISEEYRKKRLQDNANGARDWKQKATKELGDYTTTGKNASGGAGVVHFLENDKNPDGPKLVVKVNKHNPKDVKAMKEEATLYEKVGEHPNIVRCLGVQKVGGHEGLVMESVGGGELTDTFKQLNTMLESGAISEEKYWGVMQFTMQRSLEALVYLEEKGFVHNDIKPPNIMIDDVTGEPKLIDLGLLNEAGKNWAEEGHTAGYATLSDFKDWNRSSNKRDIFALGASNWEVREGKTGGAGETEVKDRFDFGDTSDRPLDEKAADWGSKGSGDSGGAQGPRALHVSENLDAVSDEVDPKTGQRKKKLRMYGANTAYVDFINQLMDPEPANRPTPKEALNHPFMRQRMLDDDTAREAVKEVVQARKNQGFTAAAFKQTLAAAVKSGELPEDPGIAADVARVAEAFDSYAKHILDFTGLSARDHLHEKSDAGMSANQALDEIDKGLKNLLAKKEFATSVTLKSYLEGLAGQIGGKKDRILDEDTAGDTNPTPSGPKVANVPVAITQGFTAAAFRQTLTAAVQSAAVPDAPGIIAGVAEALGKFPEHEANFKRLSRDDHWTEKNAAGMSVLNALDEIDKGLKNLLQKKEYAAHATLKSYLEKLAAEAREKRDPIVEVQRIGPPTITTADFKGAWSKAKASIEGLFKRNCLMMIQKIVEDSRGQDNAKQYQRAQLTQTGLDNAKTMEQYFGFNDNLGSALEAFEKAAAKTNIRDIAQTKEKALRIATQYFQNVQNKQPLPGLPDFRVPLRTALNDLVLSINRKAP